MKHKIAKLTGVPVDEITKENIKGLALQACKQGILEAQKRIDFKTIFIAAVMGAVAGTAAWFIMNMTGQPQDTVEIANFYKTEVAVMVSPHGLRKKLASKNTSHFVIVDVRSKEEYEDEHIVTALSVPAYTDKENTIHIEEKDIVAQFKKIQDKNKGKDIIIYCYSHVCMTGKKIGKLLSENNIFVKELGIGWNEWRYDWESWNYPHEWKETDVMDYISKGAEPGEIPDGLAQSGACSTDTDLGC